MTRLPARGADLPRQGLVNFLEAQAVVRKLEELAADKTHPRGSVAVIALYPAQAELIHRLEAAAEQFIVARPPFKTVIAGYHWFGDWGRDTMIALPGLLLSTNQPETAKEILLQFLTEAMFSFLTACRPRIPQLELRFLIHSALSSIARRRFGSRSRRSAMAALSLTPMALSSPSPQQN